MEADHAKVKSGLPQPASLWGENGGKIDSTWILGFKFNGEDAMEDITGTSPGKRRHIREWIDPLRLYDPRVPAGRVVFLWGLVIFPVVVIFVLLTVILIIVETVSPNVSPDYIGIIVWPFMLFWVMTTVAITRRRLLQLGRSQNWVWLAIFPIVNLPLFLYLLLKPGPVVSGGDISHSQ
jgi:uncharacterized membrane protein YhaH (DUF805 family)